MQYSDICNKKQEIVAFLKEGDNFKTYKKFVSIAKTEKHAEKLRPVVVDLYQPEEIFCRDIVAVEKMSRCIENFQMVKAFVEMSEIAKESEDLLKEAKELAFRAENVVLNLDGVKIDVGIDWNKKLHSMK